MKASQDKAKKNEKAVSFGALETKETIGIDIAIALTS